MTAPLCDCGDDAVAAGRCAECLEQLATGGDACCNCGDAGTVAHGRQFHEPPAWREYLRAVEAANGWPSGVLLFVPLMQTEDDGAACADCISWCEGCSLAYADPDYAADCCRWRCEECGQSYEFEADADDCCGLVHDYSYTPLLRFHERTADGAIATTDRARPGVLFMGVELETEHARGLLHEWYDGAREDFHAPRFVYCKHDGSLSHDGVEFVSMPATLDAFRSRWPWDAFAKLNRDGARSWYEECGLHVHVARSAFVDAQHLARFVLLQYRNRPQCVALAGRDSEQWASWDTSELLERGALPEFVKGKRHGVRYRALNFANSATVELRYFRGNLRKAGMLRVVEFVAALHDYSGRITTADALHGALDWKAFAAFLRDRRADYPYAAHWAATYGKKGN